MNAEKLGERSKFSLFMVYLMMLLVAQTTYH
jgi:hypothetical protein